MFYTFIIWLALFFLSFGVIGIHYVLMRRASRRPWQMRIQADYKPKVSILVPTYNESNIVGYKLANLVKLEYPKELTQIVVIDSNSQDRTTEYAKSFAEQHPESNIKILEQTERNGKSAALNYALKHCEGDVIIVSDADCFWPSDILEKALPFLADSNVGAISGPKTLLNPEQSWVTRTEDSYLKSINLVKLGESKMSSTLFFEGGFSAYKREMLEKFDPYNTGSDDCGTVIKMTETGSRTIIVPEAVFFTAFPTSWRGRTSMKIRRTNQLSRVFITYASLLVRNRVKSGAKRIVVQDVFLYVLSPLFLVPFLAMTVYLLLSFPFLALIFLVFLIPKVGLMLFDAVQNCLLLLVGLLSLVAGKKFVLWKKSEDRALLTENMLRKHMLI